ncbi:MAG: RimK family alpha-L-glutamate ligase [Halobacterium sp.]
MTGFDSLRVGVVTGPRTPELSAGGQALAAALRARGASASPLVWTAGDFEPFDVVVLRSCWDYHERVDEFRAWLDDVAAAGVTVLNPPGVVRWNVHKFYLRDLREAGVPVLETAFVERGTDRSLADVLDARGWDEVVVKPAVATSSAGAWRASRADAAALEDRFADPVADGDLLVQRFAPEIRDGERSLMFFGGEFSHAVHRQPAPDDFRAHPAFGADVEPYEPAESTVTEARAALAAARDVVDVAPAAVPYARVDGVLRDGEFRLMELELVEPYLALSDVDGAAERLVDAIEAAV